MTDNMILIISYYSHPVSLKTKWHRSCPLGWIAGERGRVVDVMKASDVRIYRTPLINNEISLPSDFEGSASHPIPANFSGVRRGPLQSIHRTIDARDNSAGQNDVLSQDVCRTTRPRRRRESELRFVGWPASSLPLFLLQTNFASAFWSCNQNKPVGQTFQAHY
jgi:hypothetical protein